MLPRTTINAFGWLCAAVLTAFLLPRLAQDGMFMDGELYAAVSHNQAIGVGSFWFPRFGQAGLAGLETFHEHPPLGLGMQAAWFRIWGSAFWVERAYALLMAVFTAWLLLRLWRELVPKDRAEHALGPWTLALWVIVPTVHWCFHNNMLENTMAVFTTGAVLCVVMGRSALWWHVLAGVLTALAALTKGVPGLFPLAAPVLIALIMRGSSMRQALLGSGLMVLAASVVFALLLLDPAARKSLSIYVEQRLLHRIDQDPTVGFRAATLEMLFTNMLGPLIIGAVLVFSQRKRLPPVDQRPALAMLAVGLSGVLPLMLTMVQKSFYMAAALPLVALGLALWSAPALAEVLARMRNTKAVNALRYTGMVIIAGSIVAAVWLFGTPGRDGELLADVHKVGAVVPPHSVVGLPRSMWNDWSLQTYLQRYHSISLDHEGAAHTWYITQVGQPAPQEVGYQRVEAGLTTLELWQHMP